MINETKSLVFSKKRNKIDKPLASITKEKKRGLKIRNQRGDITADYHRNTKDQGHYEQFYYKQVYTNNLEEIDKFLQMYR